ncbi:terminase [Rhodococcus pyridinivorans]|uniref:terminase n=1 Tax=Rhodococcus pyridinivorans TaxID=103816 RepID=UPI0036744693
MPESAPLTPAFPADSTLPEPAPDDLKETGRQLWTATQDDYDGLSTHELGLLRELCRTADTLDELQALLDRDGLLNRSSQGVRVHPALPELRQQRIVYARLLAALGLELGVTDEPAAPKTQRRAARGVYGITGVVPA